MANLPSSASLGQRAAAAREGASKMEAIASSAVRAADKVGASLIVVYTQSGGAPSPQRSPLHRCKCVRLNSQGVGSMATGSHLMHTHANGEFFMHALLCDHMIKRC